MYYGIGLYLASIARESARTDVSRAAYSTIASILAGVQAVEYLSTTIQYTHLAVDDVNRATEGLRWRAAKKIRPTANKTAA